MRSRTPAPGKVSLVEDPRRRGWLAKQRWPHEGAFYRSQGWGLTQGEAKAALEEAKDAKKEALADEAVQAAQQASADLRGIPRNCDLNGLFQRWMAWRRTYKPLSTSTVATYTDSWRRLSGVKPEGSEVPLGEIGIEDLAIGHVTNTAALISLGPERDRRLTLLRGLLTWTHGQGARTDRHPMAQYVPRVDNGVPEEDAEDEAEARAIVRDEHRALVWHVGAARWHHKTSLYDLGHALVLEWHLGIRIGECLALRFKDFHLEEEVPNVEVGATIIREQGGERRAGRRKANSKRIYLRLAPEVQAIVRERMQRGWHTEPDDLVFAVKRSGHHVQAGNLRRTLRRVIAEQPDRSLDGLSFHAYKRGLASDVEQVLSEAGVEAASDLTGTSKAVLRLHYIKVRGKRILDPTAFRVIGEPDPHSDPA